MSVFTISLAEVIEIHGRNNLGLESYPVLGEVYRERINNRIIDHYLNREIGQESVSLWRHAMRRKMAEIMPAYNQLYRTESLIVDPLRTVDLKTLSTSKRDAETASLTAENRNTSAEVESVAGAKSRNVSSDTPQVFLSGEGNYASSAADARNDTTGTTESKETGEGESKTDATSNSLDVMDSQTVGFQGSQADLILAFRSTIINVDMMIVNELESLFMGIWNSGDTFYNNRRY